MPLKLVHFEGANNLHTRTTAIEKGGDEAAGGAAGAVSNTALPPQQDCMQRGLDKNILHTTYALVPMDSFL